MPCLVPNEEYLRQHTRAGNYSEFTLKGFSRWGADRVYFLLSFQ